MTSAQQPGGPPPPPPPPSDQKSESAQQQAAEEKQRRAERTKIVHELNAIVGNARKGPDERIASLEQWATSNRARLTQSLEKLVASKFAVIQNQAELATKEKGQASKKEVSTEERVNSYLEKASSILAAGETWTSTQGAAASVYPDLEGPAKAALQEIGGDADIIVVPDGVNMQAGHAITLKGEMDRMMIMGQLVGAAVNAKKQVDVAALALRVAQPKVIAIHCCLAQNVGLELEGNVWHEYGHVILDREESGRVFAHELRMVLEKRGQDTARTWVKKRTVEYFASTATTRGIDELNGVLKQILDADDYREWQRLRGIADENRGRGDSTTSTSTTSEGQQ